MQQLGVHIQTIRKLRRMSLSELAKTSGVQIATLSRIENGKMTGTLASHLNIAKAMGIDIAELYQGLQEDAPDPIKADETLEAVSTINEKVSCEILTRQASSKKMLPAIIKIEGKGSTSQERREPASERFIFVLEGVVVVKVKDQAVRLEKNTSLYFNASLPHMIENPNASTAKFLSVITPVSL
ncbi:MAG: helix-turn-helix transcriptional regulator [Candidatus Omnitrophica bacterium]|nr:helix-turn-helix transcriptional regulator [Candidatus Omnitrophota bacterium]